MEILRYVCPPCRPPFRVALLLYCLLWLQVAHAQPPPVHSDFDVLHYAARIYPNLAEKSLRGSETVELVVLRSGVRQIGFDAGRLVVDEVRQHGKKLAFKKVGPRLVIQLPAASSENQRVVIKIDYHGAPRSGMEFHPEPGQIYTIFSTSEWLVCLDSPDQRASLDLRVTLPAAFKAVGNGRLVAKTQLPGKRVLYHWRQAEPVPSFVYGFAAGRFNQTETEANGIKLQFFSHELQADQLQQVFANTGDMLKYFGDRSGIPYTGTYSQALVTSTVGQELAGLALMSEDYGRRVLDDAGNEGLIAHEMAHQWWGIHVTCQSWSDFWLNEGFATFMSAAYIQHRFGDAAYQAIVERWRQRVHELAATGKDHSLVYQQWNHPSRDDRAVVYQKGAYVLFLLRSKLGEHDFWKGIRDYTRKFRGKSVTSADFQSAMEASSGHKLGPFFRQWVHGSSSKSTAPPHS